MLVLWPKIFGIRLSANLAFSAKLFSDIGNSRKAFSFPLKIHRRREFCGADHKLWSCPPEAWRWGVFPFTGTRCSGCEPSVPRGLRSVGDGQNPSSFFLCKMTLVINTPSRGTCFEAASETTFTRHLVQFPRNHKDVDDGVTNTGSSLFLRGHLTRLTRRAGALMPVAGGFGPRVVGRLGDSDLLSGASDVSLFQESQKSVFFFLIFI